MRRGRWNEKRTSNWTRVCGSVRAVRSSPRASQNRPHRRPRGDRNGKKTAGTHLIVTATIHSRPVMAGLENCAPNSSSVRGRLMLPVSRLAAIGKANRTSRMAVVIGRRAYAQLMLHNSPITVAPRQKNQATSQGRTDHGTKKGSIHGEYTYGMNGPDGWYGSPPLSHNRPAAQ